MIRVSFLLGNSPASEFCMPTFRNTLFHLHRRIGMKFEIKNIIRQAYEENIYMKHGIEITIRKRV